jgi:hypothetical protein
MAMLASCGIAALAVFAVIGAARASAQIRPYTPPGTAAPGADWTERINDLLPPGVESRAEATGRVAAYTPDPAKYPVPRTPWDGKPDFSGVYWPDANIAPPPVALESLYRQEAREYREGGGAAQGLIDWRGIDTPNYHCWPPSPVTGSMGGTVQLVSAPGYLLLLNEGGSNFRIIPIVGENGQPPSASRKASFQGSSVGHWEGDTLVVDVTNFSPKSDFMGSRENLHLVERWTRTGPDTLEYAVTIEDPTVWTRPWTVKEEFSKQNEQENRIYYEPRCHEGNYAFPTMLLAARLAEKAYAERRGPHPATKDNATDFGGLEENPLGR